MKLGSPRGMDTKRPRGSERSKPCHESQLTRRSQPPYPWPHEQAQPGVSKPCRTTVWLCQEQSLQLADPERLVIGVVDLAHEHPPSTSAHAVEIDLSLADPAGMLQRFDVGVRTSDFARNCLDLRREREVGKNGNVQSMAQCILRRASLTCRGLRPGARFRVDPIGAPSAVAGQGGAPPPTAPVSTSRNSAS